MRWRMKLDLNGGYRCTRAQTKPLHWLQPNLQKRAIASKRDACMRACGLVVAEMGAESGAIRTCSHSTEVGTAWRMRSHARQIRPSMRFRWLKHPNTTASGRTPSNARVGRPVPDWLIAAYWNLCPEMKYVGGMYSLRMSRRLDRT
jgi:hypothetical protein